jgi:hypothetical protein
MKLIYKYLKLKYKMWFSSPKLYIPEKNLTLVIKRWFVYLCSVIYVSILIVIRRYTNVFSDMSLLNVTILASVSNILLIFLLPPLIYKGKID